MSEISNNLNTKNILMKIRSKYILERIFDNINQKKKLKIILYNKKLLKNLNKKLNDYKNEKTKIIIEIIPMENIEK